MSGPNFLLTAHEEFVEGATLRAVVMLHGINLRLVLLLYDIITFHS